MVVKYWPVVVPKEESVSPFPIKQIGRKSIAEYLQHGKRFTSRGITLYTKPTDILEVGFLIRRKAGNAVQRNKTRRLFRGMITGFLPQLNVQQGYLFLFHKSFYSGSSMTLLLAKLIHGEKHVA